MVMRAPRPSFVDMMATTQMGGHCDFLLIPKNILETLEIELIFISLLLACAVFPSLFAASPLSLFEIKPHVTNIVKMSHKCGGVI